MLFKVTGIQSWGPQDYIESMGSVFEKVRRSRLWALQVVSVVRNHYRVVCSKYKLLQF